MKKLRLLGLALVLGAACYPGDPTSISEFDAIATVRNPDFTFSSSLTFYMPDEIVQINEDDPDAIPIDPSRNDEILAKVRQNLLDLGWDELDDADVQGGQLPDVAVANLVAASENTFWWVSYPGYCWDPFWCWGWYWPPYVGSSSYSAGSYFVVIVDASTVPDPGDDDEFAVAWGGAMNGVLSQSNESNFTRLLNGIDQMFEQSPYLSGSSSN